MSHVLVFIGHTLSFSGEIHDSIVLLYVWFRRSTFDCRMVLMKSLSSLRCASGTSP